MLFFTKSAERMEPIAKLELGTRPERRIRPPNDCLLKHASRCQRLLTDKAGAFKDSQSVEASWEILSPHRLPERGVRSLQSIHVWVTLNLKLVGGCGASLGR